MHNILNSLRFFGPKTRATGVPLACALVLAVTGCTRHTDISAFVQDPQPLVTSTEYRLAPPDIITIASKRVKEIDGHTEMIRPDGKITLPLLGSIFVAGKTCEEVNAVLVKAAREYYKDADISLHVSAFNSQKVYVWGEVSIPGPYPYDGTNTIFGLLARAQPTRLADKERIEVLRPNHDGKLIHRMTIDLDKMVEDGDMSLNAVLEKGDVLYIPPNALAAVGLVLQQVLLPIQPAAATVQGPADIGTQTTRRPYGSQNNNTP